MGIELKAMLVGLLLIAVVGSYAYVYKIGEDHEKALVVLAQTKANAVAKVEYTKIVKEDDNDRVQTQIVYKTITKYVDRIIDRPVYSNVCFDNDGVQLYNDSIEGTNPGESPTELPATTEAK